MVFKTGSNSEQQQQKYSKRVYLTPFFPTEIKIVQSFADKFVVGK